MNIFLKIINIKVPSFDRLKFLWILFVKYSIRILESWNIMDSIWILCILKNTSFLQEIMNGQSINRSSMKYNIPARTLRDWMKRLNIKSVFTHHSQKEGRSLSADSSDYNSEESQAQEQINNPEEQKVKIVEERSKIFEIGQDRWKSG